MKYKDYEGLIEELVQRKLKAIEEQENVKVLYAVESGSRSWGIASPDSDYDVRFVYVRQLEYYLRLQDKQDFIDWELNEILDINGWDLSKVLKCFHKSNATVFEWLNSPIVYYKIPEWNQVKEISKEYFSCKSAMYHYYATARKNYLEYLTEDYVKYKKYFYVLRPILSCKWIEHKKCAPSIVFEELVTEMLKEDMKEAVDILVSKKVKMSEADKGERIDVINDYIVDNLEYYKTMLENMEEDRNRDWESLNKVFYNILTQVGKR